MNRREFVAMACSAFGISLGGCTSLVGSRKTKIESISLMNLSEKSHQITLQVKRDAEQVYHQTFDVAKKSKFGTEANPAPVIREPWMKNPAQFTVSARLTDDEQWYQKQFPVDNRSGSCYGIVVRIGPDGRITLPNDSYAEDCS